MNKSSDQNLADLQAWFGRAISHPLPEAYHDNPLEVSRPELEPEAQVRLKGKGVLSGFSRLGIYNQQYWFRLVSIMQSEYTCAVHLMGLKNFNHWVVRFLQSHPPASAYLAELDVFFPAFMDANYHQENRVATIQSIAYDRAYSQVFDAPEGKSLASLGQTDLSQLMSTQLQLAPHCTPLELEYDFAGYRMACRQDESFTEVFELKPLIACKVVYRNRQLEIVEQPVSKTAYAVLQAFRTPILLSDAFDRLAGTLSSIELKQLEENLGQWFKQWVECGWFCIP